LSVALTTLQHTTTLVKWRFIQDDYARITRRHVSHSFASPVAHYPLYYCARLHSQLPTGDRVAHGRRPAGHRHGHAGRKRDGSRPTGSDKNGNGRSGERDAAAITKRGAGRSHIVARKRGE